MSKEVWHEIERQFATPKPRAGEHTKGPWFVRDGLLLCHHSVALDADVAIADLSQGGVVGGFGAAHES